MLKECRTKKNGLRRSTIKKKKDKENKVIKEAASRFKRHQKKILGKYGNSLVLAIAINLNIIVEKNLKQNTKNCHCQLNRKSCHFQLFSFLFAVSTHFLSN